MRVTDTDMIRIMRKYYKQFTLLSSDTFINVSRLEPLSGVRLEHGPLHDH